MVFQKPNPFPKSIYDNVAFGPRVLGMTKSLEERVERALHQAALWDEVKDRLKSSALGLSGGQQQRLCIARCLAVEPDVLLMDEPASALDPIATTRIEDLMHELKRDYTIVVVTHNMQQAARVADMTAFFSVTAARRASAPGSWSSTTRPTRSSRSPRTSAPRTTSRGGSASHVEQSPTMRIGLQQELDLLQATLMEEGELCMRSLRGAIQALGERDPELADEVIAFDDEVDARYMTIETSVESLLARQTPVASDLRFVLAVIHINLSLERIADLCVTIAKLSKLVYEVAPDAKLVEAFEEMAARGEEMLKVALQSFVDRDLQGAESLVDLDELIDRANRRAVQHVLALGSNVQLREWGLRMIVVSRCLERIGDHAVDIGEQTAYLVTGEFREFTDASHPAG